MVCCDRRLQADGRCRDESELLELRADGVALGHEVTSAIDLADGGVALAITIRLNHDE